ncbi:MAG: hypothetical protein ACRDNW_04010 [Trebonia sp.]
MTTAIAVAAVLAFSFALGSLIRQVDGATLRRWRLSRRWDVSRLAREFIKIAEEPLATLRGLTHMINAWERGVRSPSERYWLLYLRVFPERASSETAAGEPGDAGATAGERLPAAEASAAEVPDLSPSRGADPDLRALAATVKSLEQQIARISGRLDDLSRAERGERQARERSHRRKMRSRYRGTNWTPLWSVLIPAAN